MSNAMTDKQEFENLRKNPASETMQAPHSYHSHHGKTQSSGFDGSKRAMPTFFNSKKQTEKP